MPIFYGDTAYDHMDGNNYILAFDDSLYYGSQMKHRLINPNHINFNGLYFYDNPARYEEFYVELDDDLKITFQFKKTKCTFLSHVPTQRELGTCHNFDMTSDHEWDPQSIDINKISKISQDRRLKPSVFRVQLDTVYLST